MNKLTCGMALGLAAAILACGGGSASTTALTPTPAAVRTYQATASVGDFLTIIVDPNTSTINYTNHTNGKTGTVAYTMAADGAYNITTPGGGLIKAYEIPGLALVANADNTGPAGNTTSLVTAILKAPVSLGWLENQTFNYMQWRTSQGGMQIGTVSINGSGNTTTSSYWPYGAMHHHHGHRLPTERELLHHQRREPSRGHLRPDWQCRDGRRRHHGAGGPGLLIPAAG
jgi:ribosomal protein L21E